MYIFINVGQCDKFLHKNQTILTLQNLVLCGSMHLIHFFVAQNFDYRVTNHHYWLSRLDCYLSDVAVNVFVHLFPNSALNQIRHTFCSV